MRQSVSLRNAMVLSCAGLAGGCGFYGDAAMLVTGRVSHAGGSVAGLCALQLIDGERNAVLDGRGIDGSRFLEDFAVSPRSGTFRVEAQCGASSGASREFSLDEAKGGSVTIDLGTIVSLEKIPPRDGNSSLLSKMFVTPAKAGAQLLPWPLSSTDPKAKAGPRPSPG